MPSFFLLSSTSGAYDLCQLHAASFLATGELPGSGDDGPMRLSDIHSILPLSKQVHSARCDWCADGDRAEDAHQLVKDARAVLWPEGDTTSDWGKDHLDRVAAVLSPPEASHV